MEPDATTDAASENGAGSSTADAAPDPHAPIAGEARQIRADHALTRAMEALEGAEALDGVVGRVAPVVTAAVGRGRARAVLGGRWLGHALHPLMTDVPLGTWMSASLLDLFGGPRSVPAAQRLVGIGVGAAVPTALAGWSDWTTTDRPEQRVGLVHASTNVAALGLYAASWRARRRGAHRRGVVLGLVGGSTAVVGGYLGGHLAMGRGTGVDATRELFTVDPDAGGEVEGR